MDKPLTTGTDMRPKDTLRGNERLLTGISELSLLRPHKTYLYLALDWTIIGLAVWAGEASRSNLVFTICCLVIAARQHALLVMMHEGAHIRINKNPWLNLLISDFFAAFPLLLDTEGYRQNHQKHHRHLNSEKDPDWVRKLNRAEWQFPRRFREIALDAIKYIYIGAIEWVLFAILFSGLKNPKEWLTSRQIRRFLYFGAVLALIVGTHSTLLALKYWAIPLFFVFPSFQRVRSISEHFGLPRDHELTSSRNILAPAWERFVFGPHNVSYHLVHHLYPAIPFYNLPKAHRLLAGIDSYRLKAHENSSYVGTGKSVLNDLALEHSSMGIHLKPTGTL